MTSRIAVQPFSFLRTFALQSMGAYDPTASLREDCLSKVFATTNGICEVTVIPAADGVEVCCEGVDSEQILKEIVVSFGTDDGYQTFIPEHSLLQRLHRDQAGLRLIRVPWLFDIACSAVLQQRVRFIDAVKDWRHIAERHGSRSQSGRAAFPSAAALASLPSWELESMGIDAKRSRALIALARELKMNPLNADMSFAQLRGRLGRVSGVGPWTVETTLGFGAADSDALPLGDLYLPHLVAYAFTGNPQGTDEQMVELLEPFRGSRFRVVRLLYGSHIKLPRFGPLRG